MTSTAYRALVRRPPAADGCSLVDVAVVDPPTIHPGDLLLAPLVAGICGTDWQILSGQRCDDSPVLGHEGVARVVIGSGSYEPGDIVMVNPTHPTNPGFLLGHNVPGMWAERTRIPAIAVDAGLVLPVADGAARGELVGALAEPLASASYGFEIATSLAGNAARSLVIWGQGVVGHLTSALWRQARPEVPQLLVGRSHDVPGCLEANSAQLPDRLAALPGPVVAVIATPRSATAGALQRLDRHIDEPLSVDVHGGLQPGPVSLRCGVVDVSAIRAANCGGVPSVPVVATFDRPQAGALRVFGHRGVSNAQLRAAIATLTENEAVFAPLLTHVTDLDGAAELINGVLCRGRRNHGGRRVLKSAIRFDGAFGAFA